MENVVVSLTQNALSRRPGLRRWTLALYWLMALGMVAAGLLASAPAYAQERIHVVQRGESLALIAGQYNTDQETLMSLNGLANPNVIYVGQQLFIPLSAASGVYGTPAIAGELPGSDGYYIVRRGDSLAQIAQRHDMTMADVMRLNGVNDPSSIYVGQRLRVTARVSALPVAQQPQPRLADNIYIVAPGDSLLSIARKFGTTMQALMTANGLPNPRFIWVGQRLRIQGEAPAAHAGLIAAGVSADSRKWIEVNLTNQTLTAWQGDVAVLHTKISSGRKNTPTVTGHFKVLRKYKAQRMSGPGYDLPGVPWVMYFYSGYAIHGAYWHNNFGVPMSHGCVNVRVEESEMLYEWAPPGTEVYVHY
jgi:LysM repeat protein